MAEGSARVLRDAQLAEEWTYRFLGAAFRAAELDSGGQLAVDDLAGAPTLAAPAPTLSDIRAWARANGYSVSDRGVSREVLAALEAADAER